MAKEIERKFLVKDDSYINLSYQSIEISQGYISTDPDRVVRIRTYSNKGFMTVKTRNIGITRKEWDFEIPYEDAKELLDEVAVHKLEKTRYYFSGPDGYLWEIDRFGGSHEGLVIAEVELPYEDATFEMPSFVGEEVTGDPQYYNSNLATQA